MQHFDHQQGAPLDGESIFKAVASLNRARVMSCGNSSEIQSELFSHHLSEGVSCFNQTRKECLDRSLQQVLKILDGLLVVQIKLELLVYLSTTVSAYQSLKGAAGEGPVATLRTVRSLSNATSCTFESIINANKLSIKLACLRRIKKQL